MEYPRSDECWSQGIQHERAAIGDSDQMAALFDLARKEWGEPWPSGRPEHFRT
jgi:hypothetical protein